MAGWRTVVVGLAFGAACASSEDLGHSVMYGVGEGDATVGTLGGEGETKGDEPEDGDPVLDGDSDDDDGGGDGTMPPDLGPCAENADCLLPGYPCVMPEGTCEDGMCVFLPAGLGTPCDDGDACTTGDACDGMTNCVGSEVPCMPAHASGGTCVDGQCVDPACDAGWEDCDGDPGNGCEVELGTVANCGDCGDTCQAGPHSTASCNGFACSLSCTSPYEDCDGNAVNGCEIPTGIANQCDANGLNATNGCWTAHCGSSGNVDAYNFGSWYCFECTTCEEPTSSSCHWCSHETGTWFPAESGCACGAYEDLVCG